MFLVTACSCLRSIRWSQMLSWEWRCSWSSADRRCSNYIWEFHRLLGCDLYYMFYGRCGRLSDNSYGTCASWRLKAQANKLFVHQLVQANKKHQIPALLALFQGKPQVPSQKASDAVRIFMPLLRHGVIGGFSWTCALHHSDNQH